MQEHYSAQKGILGRNEGIPLAQCAQSLAHYHQAIFRLIGFIGKAVSETEPARVIEVDRSRNANMYLVPDNAILEGGSFEHVVGNFENMSKRRAINSFYDIVSHAIMHRLTLAVVKHSADTSACAKRKVDGVGLVEFSLNQVDQVEFRINRKNRKPDYFDGKILSSQRVYGDRVIVKPYIPRNKEVPLLVFCTANCEYLSSIAKVVVSGKEQSQPYPGS